MNPELRDDDLPWHEDPRSTPGFPLHCYPGEVGSTAEAPAYVTEAKARFKAVYARRNACLEAMARSTPEDTTRPLLAQQVVHLTEAIDRLEDAYAPVGFVAEPVLDDTLFTRELHFTHATHPRAQGQPIESSFSLYIPIPLDNVLGKEDSRAP